MALPLRYNLRNLLVRRTVTIMTSLGLGLTVAVLLCVFALTEGLRVAFGTNGHPLQFLVMRKGATTEMFSNFSRQTFNDLKFRAGIARTEQGEPMASLELVTVVTLESVEAPDGVNVNLRGVTPIGLRMRERMRLVEGRWFQRGMREVVVGRAVAARHPAARSGGKLFIGRAEWTVCGVADTGDSAADSEILADLQLLAAENNRAETLSSVLVRAQDEVALQSLVNSLPEDRRLNVDAVPEQEYYRRQTSSGLPVQVMGTLVAAIMAVGSCFAAMNTMYASVARRSREIGTLRILGFSKASILFSFVLESAFLAALGGVAGCLLVLPLNGLESGIGSFTTFAETAFKFRVTLRDMAAGVAFAIVVGVIGGLFPAAAAARKQILAALRAV